jgi:hypothetical protein
MVRSMGHSFRGAATSRSRSGEPQAGPTGRGAGGGSTADLIWQEMQRTGPTTARLPKEREWGLDPESRGADCLDVDVDAKGT